MEPKLILIDLDDTFVQQHEGLIKRWSEKHPDKPLVRWDERRGHDLAAEFGEHKQLVHDIFHEPGFVSSLEPMPGAVEAVREMMALGHKVKFCSAPFSHYENCVEEKYASVERLLGRDFTKMIVLSRDKTIIWGDFLIDDKPQIEKGDNPKPSWEHVLFDTPYNRHVTNKRRLNWSNWREVLGL